MEPTPDAYCGRLIHSHFSDFDLFPRKRGLSATEGAQPRGMHPARHSPSSQSWVWGSRATGQAVARMPGAAPYIADLAVTLLLLVFMGQQRLHTQQPGTEPPCPELSMAMACSLSGYAVW